MFTMGSQYPVSDSYQHKRAKSSVLSNLSFMHRRMPSEGAVLSSNPPVSYTSPTSETVPFTPQDHPHFRALAELQQNHQSQSPSAPTDFQGGKRPNTSDNKTKALHKKTLSSISLKSLAGKEFEKITRGKESKSSKPKKTKSSTNLAALLGRPKSSKNLRKEAAQEAKSQKDKENENPSRSTSAESNRPPPIYAQFSSEHFAKQPLGGKFLEDEIDRYTPENYSPRKQRNFYEGPSSQPTLVRRDEGESQRPRSTYLPSSFSMKDITRHINNGSRNSAEIIRRASGPKRPSLDRKATESPTKTEKSTRSRVFAAVSSFGSKHSKHGNTHAADVADNEVDMGPVLKDKDVDKEFEAMLDRRNIPEHQRGKMRSLAMSLKKDFVKQDWAETAGPKNGRPGTNGSDSSADATAGIHDIPEVKSKKTRSRTFTLSRASGKEHSSPAKKKSEGTFKHSRTKSSDSIIGGSKSLTAAGASVAQTLIAKAKGQLADDFVSYLRKVQKPELVEVGRLHKLRLLLRNETVAWTDDFIQQGGLEEIVGLLHRTMEVEWREEHEDALLHEALLCMKALSTTELALHHLDKIQKTLFPALLAMVFDEEKKGPSEFTTRNIITSLLFTYLKSSPLSERTQRAQTLLSYLRDPEPSESQRPVGFVLEMRRPRPYRVWCKEVTDVTKEVFWIFLHNMNVIALPGGAKSYELKGDAGNTARPSGSLDQKNAHYVYMEKHFPKERPPVPAAPYVGGVEWDATNYLASHLDILNGILASLPTQAERNALREQLVVSGWERCMGGTLRLCKEKFYGGVHDGLRCWVAAAAADNWDTRDVRCGPCIDPKSPVRKSPKKTAPEPAPPKIEMKLDFAGSGENQRRIPGDDIWL